MANNVTTIIDTVQNEADREDFLYMMECFDACEEAKQNEKRLKTELKITRIKLARMHNSGVWCGAGHDAALEQIVKLTMALSQVWAKYDRMMFGE